MEDFNKTEETTSTESGTRASDFEFGDVSAVTTAAAGAEKAPKSPEEVAFQNAIWQRTVITKALKEDRLACLPGTDGLADTKPAVNPVNGTHYHGVNHLFLKDFQKHNNFPTAEFVTFDQVQKAKEKTGQNVFVQKGEKGVTISFKAKIGQTNEYEQKNIRLFNVAQLSNPGVIREYAKQLERDKEQYLRQQHGDSYRPPEEKKSGPDIACSSTEPQKYLGQYLAAVSTGGSFKATAAQAAEFKKNLGDTLFERNENGKLNPFKLSNICANASNECKEVMRGLFQRQQQAPAQSASRPEIKRQKEDMSLGR